MHYWGGKHFIAKEIERMMRPFIWGRRVVEPFCGALNVTQYLHPAIANDVNKNIIDMYGEWRAGWRPKPITKEEYKHIITVDSFERGFYGVGCSFSGQWCGTFIGDIVGYEKHGGSHATYFNLAYRGLDKKIKRLPKDIILSSGQYHDIKLQHDDVVYCDPPYNNTICVYAEPFNSKMFWEWVLDYSNNCLFFVSEFNAPEYAKVIWDKECTTHASSNKKKTNEKLFMVGK